MLQVRRTLPISLAILIGTLSPAVWSAELRSEAADETPAASKDPGDAIDMFLSSLQSLCNQAFEGRIVANEPAAANDPFVGKKLVMHVLYCAPGEIRIPFHVGDDHSRTWVITRHGATLGLKHDHRHEDGTADALTHYGGDTIAPGTAIRQEFPADAYSKELFQRQGIAVSTANVWAMEIEPGRRFVYELSRPGRLFRVEFVLSRPVDAPPLPWGYGAAAVFDSSAQLPTRMVDGCRVTATHWSWFGTRYLQVVLGWVDGVLNLNDRLPRFAQGARGIKVAWDRKVPGPLEIHGRRLDAESPPLRAEIPSGYGDVGGQSTYVIFPAPGCWEVTGSVAGHSLAFVTLVHFR